MLPCKEFYILWICIIWTRVECGDASTSRYLESTSEATKLEKSGNDPSSLFNPDTFEDDKKKDLSDSTVRSFFPTRGMLIFYLFYKYLTFEEVKGK